MRPLGGETVVIIKPSSSTETVDNSTRYVYDPPGAEITLEGCNVQPFLLAEKLQREVTRERDYARTTWRVWVPVTDDTLAISHHDRVEWRGQQYEVFGLIGLWSRFSGIPRHIQFTMELRTG